MNDFNFPSIPDYPVPQIPYLPDPAIMAGRDTVDAMHTLMSGDATFAALKDAVNEIRSRAPEDHDVLIQAFNILVSEVSFLYPHTLLLSGFNHSGHRTVVVVHYSQMIAHVVYLPKRGPERIITGFKAHRADDTNA